jgi:hypothetical protein
MLPVRRLAVALMLMFAGCRSSVALDSQVEVCPALVGDASGGAKDFTDVACATRARLRLIGRDSGGSVPVYDDQCIDLAARGLSVARLFHATPTEMPEVHLEASASPLALEVSLFPPWAGGCRDDAPLLALGRSALIDAQSGARLDGPLGIRHLCAADRRQRSIQVTPYQFVNGVSFDDTKELTLGELFAYSALTSTGGVCKSPAPQSLRGEFRSIDTTQTTAKQMIPNIGSVWITTFDGEVGFEPLYPATPTAAGCVVVKSKALSLSGTAMYSCLDSTQTDLKYAPILEAQYFDKVLAQAPKGASRGTLVVLISDFQTQKPLANVRLLFDSTTQESVYPTDPNWDHIGSNNGAGTVANIGFAVFYDAPTGVYRASVPGRGDLYFNAGTASDPLSITAVSVQ